MKNIRLRTKILLSVGIIIIVPDFSVIDANETIGSHNNDTLWHTPVQGPILREYLRHRKQMTIFDGNLYRFSISEKYYT